MYKILRADKDTYITNRLIKGTRVVDANVGAANTLDLFKLYGFSFSGSNPNTELSRILVHFDLDPIRDLISSQKISITDPSFSCKLVMKDVDGGQPCPSNFTISVNPLAVQFDEGLGRDIAQYTDIDVCNFLTASDVGGPWALEGCGSGSLDYYATPVTHQLFQTGFEDLSVDVTAHVTSSLLGNIVDAGFRIALSASHETDLKTYFVKRFGARSVFDKNFQPTLVVKFDDSIQDDTQLLTLDDTYTLLFYNYSRNQPANILSASSTVGDLTLRLVTEISGGTYEFPFSGGRYVAAGAPVTGVYSASINLSSTDPVVALKLAQTGTLIVTPIWGSLDGTVGFSTGSKLTIPARDTSNTNYGSRQYIVTCQGLKADILEDEALQVRVNFFDPAQNVVAVKRPVMTPGVVIRDTFYSVRDIDEGVIVIPFDSVTNTTRLSSDRSGMYFNFDASSFLVGHRYVIDIKTIAFGQETLYQNASPAFRIRIH